MMRIVSKPSELFFLLCSSLVFFLLRFPSLFEPHWYGDEGIYQAIGYALNNGRELYSTIWDNKPPLLYVLYAVFNSDQFTLRSLSLLAGISSIIAFFFLAKKIYRNRIGHCIDLGSITPDKYLFIFFNMQLEIGGKVII